MKELSRLAKNVNPSTTLAIDAMAKQMRADGLDVIGFGAGEPDFETPVNIQDAAIDAIRKGKTILATDKGVQLIQIVPQELSSPEMTGRWELALDQITDGKQDADKFMDSIRKFSTFLVNFARNNRADVVFPDDGRRKKRAQSFVTRGTKIDGCVCPVCRKGGVLESPQAFFCSRRGGRLPLHPLEGLPDARRRADADGKAAAPAAGKTGCARLNGRNHPAGRRDFVLPQRLRPLTYEKKSTADMPCFFPLMRVQ